MQGEVIGVVASVKHKGLELDAEPAFYVSYEQSTTFPIMNFVIRTQADPESLVAPVQHELQAVDARGVVFVSRLKLRCRRSAPRKFNLALLGLWCLALVPLRQVSMQLSTSQLCNEAGDWNQDRVGAEKITMMKLILVKARCWFVSDSVT